MTNLVILLLIWCTGMVLCYAWFVGLLLRWAFDAVIISEPVAARTGSDPGTVLCYAEAPRKTGLLRRWPAVAAGYGILIVLVPMALPSVPLLLMAYWNIAPKPGVIGAVALGITMLAVAWVSYRGLRPIAGRPAAANWRHLGRAILYWLAVLLVAWVGLEWRVQRILDATLAKADALTREIGVTSSDAGIAASLYEQAGVLTLAKSNFDDGWDLVRSDGRVAPAPAFPEAHAFRIPLLRQAAAMETSGLSPPLSTFTINTTLPYIVGIRVQATILHRHAISEARAGRLESAIADINTLQGMARQTERNHCLVEVYQGWGIRRLAIDALQHVLPRVEDPQLLDQIHLDNRPPRVEIVQRITRGELGVLQRRSIVLMLRCQTPYFLYNVVPLRYSGVMVAYRTILGEQDIDLIERYAKELPAAVPSDPIAAAARSSAVSALAVSARHQTAVASDLIPMLSKGIDREVEEIAMRDLTRAAIAATRFRLQQGRLPISFEELVSAGLLPAVPTDPFDGKPMRFAMHDGYAFIYTIGASRKDGGGWPYMLDPAGDVVPSNPGLILSAGRPLWELDLVPRAATLPFEEEP